MTYIYICWPENSQKISNSNWLYIRGPGGYLIEQLCRLVVTDCVAEAL